MKSIYRFLTGNNLNLIKSKKETIKLIVLFVSNVKRKTRLLKIEMNLFEKNVKYSQRIIFFVVCVSLRKAVLRVVDKRNLL